MKRTWECLQDQLKCSVCFEVLHDPLTLPTCHHNFCRACIISTLQPASATACPDCGTPFQVQDLHVNATLKGACEMAKRLSRNNCSEHRESLKYYCLTCDKHVCDECCILGECRSHEVQNVKDAKRRALPSRMRSRLESLQEEGPARSSKLEQLQKSLSAATQVAVARMVQLYSRGEAVMQQVLKDLLMRFTVDTIRLLVIAPHRPPLDHAPPMVSQPASDNGPTTWTATSDATNGGNEEGWGGLKELMS